VGTIEKGFINFTAFLEYSIIAGVGIIVAIMLFITLGYGVKEKVSETRQATRLMICPKAFIPSNCNALDIDGDGKEDCVWDVKRKVCVPK